MTHQTITPSEEKPQRLPCRGCMSDCPNYATCDGTPWRADKEIRVGVTRLSFSAMCDTKF